MNPTLDLTKHPANPEQSAALSAITELLAAHHADAEDSADEDGKFSIAFKVTFDRSYNPTKLKVTSRISQSITDEIETTIDTQDNPNSSEIKTNIPGRSRRIPSQPDSIT